MKNKDYDFCGWATKYDVKCSDGRTIQKGAFKDCDGKSIPLVWNHQHNSQENVLGHAILEHRNEGVYAYGYFNDTESGKDAKEQVKHKDLTSLSIYANRLTEKSGNVMHGVIRELSLVLAGANPGAMIETVLAHSDTNELEEAIIYNNYELELAHSEEEGKMENNNSETKKEETVEEIFDSLTDKQKTVVEALIGAAIEDTRKEYEDADDSKEGKKETMKHNAFENENTNNEEAELMHAEILAAANDRTKGSMKEAFIAHGITNIEYLFPDAHEMNGVPRFLNHTPKGWVKKVMDGVHKSPFAKVKMTLADISLEEARAKGYVKGDEKTDEQFSLLTREIGPQTVYKHQSFDRDDLVDITDINTVSWVKGEMRLKLDEELARAFLFGDGRATSSKYKIKEANIKPIIKDTENNLYAMVYETTGTPTDIIDDAVRGLKNYEGSGNIIGYFRNTDVCEMLLIKDLNGHRIYKDINELATSMRLKGIVEVPDNIVPEGYIGVAVDLADYNVGADKGGSVNMFEDFDIDYNKEKYLIETRCSAALYVPHSALVLKKKTEVAAG